MLNKYALCSNISHFYWQNIRRYIPCNNKDRRIFNRVHHHHGRGFFTGIRCGSRIIHRFKPLKMVDKIIGAFKDGKKKIEKIEDKGKGNELPSYGKNSVPIGPYREVNGFPAKVKPGSQEKHIPNTPNYKQELANGKIKKIGRAHV